MSIHAEIDKCWRSKSVKLKTIVSEDQLSLLTIPKIGVTICMYVISLLNNIHDFRTSVKKNDFTTNCSIY